MRSALRLLALEWAPIWLLLAVLVMDALVVKDSRRGVGMLAPPRVRACIVAGPTGCVVEDEKDLRVELWTNELSLKESRGEVRVLATMYQDQRDLLRIGLIMECAQGDRVGIHAWANPGQTLPPEEMMRRGFAEVLAKRAAAWPRSREAEAKQQLDYAERLARGERWRWTLSPGACVHEAGVAWVLLMIVVRVWKAWSEWVARALQAAARGMLAAEDAVRRRGIGEPGRVEGGRS